MGTNIPWESFRQLSEDSREELFAYSCLSYNQIWKEGQLSDRRRDEILDRGQELMDELLPKGLHKARRDSSYATDDEYVKQILFEGDRLTVPFVAHHLEDSIGVAGCETESDNPVSEPDLIIEKKGSNRAKVEIKRTVSSGNTYDYVSGFTKKNWHTQRPAVPSVLIMYFPSICGEPAWRIDRLTRGYQEWVKTHPDWNDDWMQVRTVSAPLEPNRQFGPLATTERIVRAL